MPHKLQSHIRDIKLVNFRNYTRTKLDSGGQSVVLLGDNGVGKTNMLEAVSLLSKGQGMRGVNMDCMQNNSSENPWSVHYSIHNNEELTSVSIAKHNGKRCALINEKSTTYTALRQLMCVVWLVPQLDHILLKSSSERLKFFDRVVHMFDHSYSLHMIKYEKARRDRSKILHETPNNHRWLSALENTMATSGIHIAQTRRKVLNLLHQTMASGSISSPFLQCIITMDSRTFELLDQHHEGAVEHYRELLEQSRRKDILRSGMGFGVHNDNFQILNAAKNLAANYCSTGEQKILLLSLLLTAVLSKYHLHGQPPIVLLDDIMSHLDKNHRDALLSHLIDIGCQVWITDLDKQNFTSYKHHFACFHISDNSVTCVW